MRTTFGERLIIVAILALVSVLAIQTCSRKADQLNKADWIIQLQKDTIERVKDAAGREHAARYVELADIETLQVLHKKELDSIIALLNIKAKQIDAVQMAGTVTSGSIRPTVDTVNLDSGRANYGLSYADQWLTLNGSIGQSNIINYQYRDSLVFTTYKEKKGYRINAYSLNPNTTLSGIKALQIPPLKAKLFGIGPYLGISYRQGKWVPQAGVGVHFNVINF